MTARRAAFAAAALWPAWAFACQPALHGRDVQTLEGKRHVVALRVPAPLPLSQFFALDLAVCAQDGGRIDPPRVDATMPQHGHGMNYRPTVEPLGEGRYRVNGMLLHMPGRWQLSIAVGSETLRLPLVVD
jgi:hypothetical protein